VYFEIIGEHECDEIILGITIDIGISDKNSKK